MSFGVRLGGYRKVIVGLAWLAGLFFVPWLAERVAGTTEVVLGYSPASLYAEVNGTRLDVPPESLAAIGITGSVPFTISTSTGMEPEDSSLYFQPAQSNLLGFLGKWGERLQDLRPRGEWVQVAGSEVGSGQGTLSYRLEGGRVPSSVTFRSASWRGDNGYSFVIRPERRNMAWWRLEGGQPVEQVASAIYRPRGITSVRDMAAELLLIAWAAGALAFVAWLVNGVVRWWNGRRGEAETDREADARAGPVARRLGRGYAPSLALFFAGTIVAATACLAILDGIPHVQDDVAYIFQGRIFALGRSWVPVPPGPEFFANGFIQYFEGRWFSKYPPGYPLMLVPGLWAGMPWLINALSAGVALALVYDAGRRMFGLHVAAWAGLLGLLSPWVIFMSGSYMSHPTTMMWVALFLYAIVRMHGGSPEVPGSKWRLLWPLLGGFAIGMAFITRQWTALGIGVGVAVWALGDLVLTPGRERWVRLRQYLLVVVGFVPPLLFILYENRQLTGEWLRFAQDLVGSYDRPGFGPGHGDAQGHTPALGVYNALVYLRTLATVFDGWPAPLALAPIFLGLFAWVEEGSRRKLAWDALLWLGALGLVGAYFLWWSSTTIFGPRYWYEATPFLLLVAGRGLDLLGRIAAWGFGGALAKRVRWMVPGTIVGVLALYTLSQSVPYWVEEYRDYNGISVAALRNSEEAGLKNALVFVELDPAKPNRDYGKVFFANDPLLHGDRVYARDLGAERNRGLAAQFPERMPYWLPLNGPPQPGFGPQANSP